MSISCIYKITNTINGKVYIGQTTDYNNRKTQHLRTLRHNNHANIHLQYAWNKYGEENFVFEIIEETSPENLLYREDYWIQYYNSDVGDYGYNIVSKNRTYKSNAYSRPYESYVVLLNNDEVFETAYMAGNKYNIDNSSISKCCKGKLNFAGIINGVKYVWRLKSDYDKMLKEEIKEIIDKVNSMKPKTTGKKVVCIELNEIFESIMEASRILKERGFVHVSPSSLADNLKERCSHGGYDSNGNPLHWKYLE